MRTFDSITFDSGLFPSTFDLILNYLKQSIMKSDVYETDISDHQKTIFSVFRKPLRKATRKLFVLCYKRHEQNSFKEALRNKILTPKLSFEQFLEIFGTTLDEFAPYNLKKIRQK